MNFRSFLSLDRSLLFVLLVAFFSRLLLFIFGNFDIIWWDAGVYVGMGKFLYSFGNAGMWEHIRPPLLPFFLGFFWFLNLSPIVFGRILELVFFMFSVFFLYGICKGFFGSRSAVIAALLFIFSPIVFYMSFNLYTEIPAVFFILGSIWFFLRNKFFVSGIFVGLSFLMKFPTGVFILLLSVFLLSNIRKLLYLLLGFVLTIFPYFLINWVFFGNPLVPLLAASDAISRALGCNVLRYKPWFHYFWLLLFSEIPLNLFAVPGFFIAIRKNIKGFFICFLSLVLPLIYFINLHCRDYRYLILFYPFVAIFAAVGLTAIFDKVRNIFFIILVLFVVVAGSYVAVDFYVGNSNLEPYDVDFFTFLPGNVSGEVWSSNPVVSVYSDLAIKKIYYPIYDGGVSTDFLSYLSKNNVSYVMMDECGGGLLCAEDDVVCQRNTQEVYELLNGKYSLVYNNSVGACWFRVWH